MKKFFSSLQRLPNFFSAVDQFFQISEIVQLTNIHYEFYGIY